MSADTLVRPGQTGHATGLDETLDHDKDSGDEFAHYVKATALQAGGTVEALCGKKWIAGKNPDGLPVCPTCKDMLDLLRAMDAA